MLFKNLSFFILSSRFEYSFSILKEVIIDIFVLLYDNSIFKILYFNFFVYKIICGSRINKITSLLN
jgi:hypothetical protein